MELIFPDAATTAADDRIGGKARGLADLHLLDCPVPDFCVVGSEAFRAHLRTGGIPAALGLAELRLADDPRGVADVARGLYDAVAGVPAQEDVATSIAAALERLGGGPYAVRSSMVGEDSARHSFAGQLDSELYLTDAAAITAAVVRCWASAFGPRALAYALAAGFTSSALRMGVVVQRMVDPQVSGVIFTADPRTGRRDEMLVSAAWGVGEGVVSGAGDTDEYTWSVSGGERHADVADKRVQVVRGRVAGTVEAPVEGDRRRARCLSPEQVDEVGQVAARIAAAAGHPMDIEWSYAAGKLWILQARPVTSLPPSPGEGTAIVWDNSNIQESYCGVTTPLTFSFASNAYHSVYRQFAGTFGVGLRRLAELDPVVRNMLGLVDGRVYYNLNNWYELISIFPAFARNKADMERMMGVEEPVDFVQDPPNGWRARTARTRQLAGAGVRLLPRMRHLDAEVDAFCTRFDAVVSDIDRTTLRERSLEDLHNDLERLTAELLDHWETPIVNDLRVMTTSGRLRRKLKPVHGEDTPARYAELVGGIEGLESVAPTRTLMRIAADVRRHGAPALQALLGGTPLEAWRALHEQEGEIGAALDTYVERYGDRVIGELKLETVTLRDDPSFIVEVLRNFVPRADLDPDVIATDEQLRYRRARTDTERRLPPQRRPGFARAVDAARTAVAARERLRLLRTVAFGLARDVFLGMGERLFEAGVLDAPRDVFYLTTDELEAYLEGRAVTLDLAGLAAIRRAEFARYEQSVVPNRFESHGPPPLDRSWSLLSSLVADPTTPVLTGLGCGAGAAEGLARVVLTREDDLDVNGRVLVTVRTDPGWAPLFPTCAGLVVERGSSLSHSAVIAREMGIPAVVGVPDVTRIVRDGERLRIDGNAGRVERLDAGDEDAVGGAAGVEGSMPGAAR